MAVIDQDNFSNVSWHSDQPGAAGSSSAGATSEAPEPDPVNGRHEEEDAHREPGHAAEQEEGVLDCTVTNPIKENDGTKDAYVSYEINTYVGLSLAVPRGSWPCVSLLESQTGRLSPCILLHTSTIPIGTDC